MRLNLAIAFLLSLLFVSVDANVGTAAPANTSRHIAKIAADPGAIPRPYYIEFRVAQIGAYGHSYVAYGRLNAQGQPIEWHYADLHPVGNYALMAIGHIVPVPATAEWDADVLKLPVSASYRRKLNSAEYKRLVLAIQRARSADHTYWNAVTNNCNHFVGSLAKEIGLRSPSTAQPSYTFVPELRELNGASNSNDGT